MSAAQEEPETTESLLELVERGRVAVNGRDIRFALADALRRERRATAGVVNVAFGLMEINATLLDERDRARRIAVALEQELAHAGEVDLVVGSRVKLLHGSSADARRWWTVQAADDRYVVLTRQAEFQPRGKLLYTIIDWEFGRRGPCNLIGQGWPIRAESVATDAGKLLAALRSGEVEVSQRNNVPIGIVARAGQAHQPLDQGSES